MLRSEADIPDWALAEIKQADKNNVYNMGVEPYWWVVGGVGGCCWA